MSFKQNHSGVSIVNRALGMVAESKKISSFEDAGKNAELARTWYGPTVALLLEMHHWGLATKHTALATVDNARSAEWLYAYEVPDDMAFPVGFALASGVSSMSYYRGLAGLVGMLYGRPIFRYHTNTIYSSIEGDLEYVSYDITEADFNETFADILTIRLAAKFALELPKDFELSQELEDAAAVKINMAMASNLNAGNRKYGNIASEAELVRGSLTGHSWDYFSRGPGQ